MANRHPFEIIKEHHKKYDDRFLRERTNDLERLNEQDSGFISKEAVEFAIKNATYWEAEAHEGSTEIRLSLFGVEICTISVPDDADTNEAANVSISPADDDSLKAFADRLLNRVREHSEEYE